MLLPVLLLALATQASPPPQPAAGEPAGENVVTYRLEPEASTVHVLIGSSGLFGFMGHEHVVDVPQFTGKAEIDSTDVTRFRLTIVAPADSLRVIDEGRDPESSRKIEADMKEDVLESAKYPTITLRGLRFVPDGSKGKQAGGAWGTHESQLALALHLHGVEKTLDLPLLLELDRNQLRARGKFSIRHSDFDMDRKKVAGVVNVAEKIEIEYDVVGRMVESGAE